MKQSIVKLYGIWLVAFLTGCSSVSTIRDVPGGTMTYREKRTWAVGSRLFIEVEQEPGYNLARITPVIYDGAVYLEQLRISSGSARIEVFEIDMSDLSLSDDWQEKVYWITEGSWDNLWQVVTHQGPLPQHVGRTKVDIQKRRQGGNDD